MRSTPEIDAKLKALLQKAVEQFADNSADKFGQMIGYANGGYVREVLNGAKPVREALIDRVHAHEKMRGWFDSALTPLARQRQPQAVVPLAQISIDQALQVLATALKKAAPEHREALAANLAGMARNGGNGPWASLVHQLLIPERASANGTGS